MKNLNKIEKNISASFAYVKKDILMLNDAFSNMHDKIQQLANSQSDILDELKELKDKLNKKAKKTSPKKKPSKKIINYKTFKYEK